VPAVAVRRIAPVLFFVIGRKGCVGGILNDNWWHIGEQWESFFEMVIYYSLGVSGFCGGKVKCMDPTGTITGVGGLLSSIEAKARRCGNRTGLGTPVVHADNDGY